MACVFSLGPFFNSGGGYTTGVIHKHSSTSSRNGLGNYWPPPFPPPLPREHQDRRRPSFSGCVRTDQGLGLTSALCGEGCALCGGPRGCASAVPSYGRASPTREAPRSRPPRRHRRCRTHPRTTARTPRRCGPLGSRAVICGLSRRPKGRARPLELRFFCLSSLSSPSASLPVTRRVPLLTIGCDDTAVTLHKIRSVYVAVYCLDFLAEVCQYGGVVFQESAAVRTDKLFKRGDESANFDCCAYQGKLTATFQ